jgi:hypothetical protein
MGEYTMAYEQREGDIVIFKNDKATGNQPQYRGTAMVDGTKKNISLWVKDGSKGKFFAGKIENDVTGLNRGINEIDRSRADEIPPEKEQGLPF